MFEDAYFWFKSLHVISVFAWMAGLFYLPRLYVYHSTAEVGSELSETFKVMERRLLRAIMHPAMGASIIFGLLTVAELDAWREGWFHIKATAVILMVIFQVMLGRYRVAFLEDRNVKSEKFFRKINEIPTILLIIIVVMVVAKPF